MNKDDLTLKELFCFIDDNMLLHIHVPDGDRGVHDVSGTVEDLGVMLDENILNRTVDIMTSELKDVCVVLYPTIDMENAQKEDLSNETSGELAAPEREKAMRLSEALETYMNDRVVIYFTETIEQIHGQGGFFGTILNEATLNKIVRDISRNDYGYAIRVEG